MSDASMEMLASELSDKQQLRRALDQLVQSCEEYHPDSPGLVAALVFARGALDDTSHEGWLQRMKRRAQEVRDQHIAECERDGHPGVVYSRDAEPRCIYCEQVVR